MRHVTNATKIEIGEITAVSITEPGMVEWQLRDCDEREWVIRLPLDVLDGFLMRVAEDRVLVLRAETPGGHARLSYPMGAWEVFRDPASPEPTFSCRTGDGCGLEVGFKMDPITAVRTLAVTVAAD
jgi:hypothetical protein